MKKTKEKIREKQGKWEKNFTLTKITRMIFYSFFGFVSFFPLFLRLCLVIETFVQEF